MSIPRFGGADVLDVTDVPAPDPGPGQVSIDVTHAAVGLADVLMRRGDFGGDPPIVPGLEVAGTVRDLGAGVDDLRVGQPVVTLSRPTAGGYAEISVADAGVTIALPDGLDPALAVATVPNTTTAVVALIDLARLAAGERLLVHGGLGALSAVVAQVGRALGAREVVGTVRRAVESAAGYDRLVRVDELDGAFDVIVDPVGGAVRRASLERLATLGRLVCVGNASGDDDVTVGGNELWLANTAVLGLNAGGLFAEHPEVGRQAAHRALELLGRGEVVVPYRTLPLASAADAHDQLERGGLRERLVLTI